MNELERLRLLADYDAWCIERAEYAEADGMGWPTSPTSNEWAASDDTAVELLHRFATAMRQQ